MMKYPDWKTEVSDWTSIKLDENVLIRYSKKVDALPVTTFGLDIGSPCMDSGAQVNPFYYALELNKYKECPMEIVNQM